MTDQFAHQEDCYRTKLRNALSDIEDALDILDLADGPFEVSALLEQARHRLWEYLDLGA
jgi:hypothetical protein